MTDDTDVTPSPELDRIDNAILAVLAVEARISMTELAQRVGLSKTPVIARMKRLEREGYITSYRAQLSAKRLGLDHVAFIEMRLSDTREAALSAFNKAVQKIPEIEECYMIAGGFDYLLKVRTRDIREYRRVLSEGISTLPHVAATSTYVAMEAVKDSGVNTL
ncbi:Lrp/AsnC family transcriptional regulator [Qingshengfaniella alkalisoli]|uniref:Winged helix-turn-helix transcriptional regulator n=1 Tax=Qingshengfaniella alkalisoli TaxID=2599296 RepID=A0A5B8IVJ8_9RHOB|nr:Lrp/AsnC ligand binding domain-containing protein [Qingshengfaniella alkalisoli]QDY68891.1 winged helix-turn-helix transcriptional regulator [Qingshengfaniella alkalisoli]